MFAFARKIIIIIRRGDVLMVLTRVGGLGLFSVGGLNVAVKVVRKHLRGGEFGWMN